MKQLWSGIKSVIGIRKSSNVNVINKLKDTDGNINSDPTVITNIFNGFHVNVTHDITKHLTRPNKSTVTLMGDRARGVASPKKLGWTNVRDLGAKPPEKFFTTTTFGLSENVGNALLAFLNHLENFGKAALSSRIFRNSGHFCKNKNRTVKYYAHDNRFCVVLENIKP